MKFAFLTILVLLSFGCSAKGQNSSYELERFRESRDKSFRSARETPLKAEDFANFDGLKYFDASEKYVVKARLEKTTEEQIFMMPASVGAPVKYLKYGVLTFELNGKNYTLIAFRSETSAKKNGSIFVPFRDLTNGKETYGAGRYLEIKAPPGDEAVLDFNFAYNPICAYGNENYSCPLPPRENYLQTEIKAGEKIFAVSAKSEK